MGWCVLFEFLSHVNSQCGCSCNKYVLYTCIVNRYSRCRLWRTQCATGTAQYIPIPPPCNQHSTCILVKHYTHERNDFPVAICTCIQRRKSWKVLPYVSMPKHQTQTQHRCMSHITRAGGCKHPRCLKLLYHESEINSAKFSERIKTYTFGENNQLFWRYMVTLSCEQGRSQLPYAHIQIKEGGAWIENGHASLYRGVVGRLS